MDCPGIDENNMAASVRTVLDELENSDAFVFLVDTSVQELGVRRQGVCVHYLLL